MLTVQQHSRWLNPRSSSQASRPWNQSRLTKSRSLYFRQSQRAFSGNRRQVCLAMASRQRPPPQNRGTGYEYPLCCDALWRGNPSGRNGWTAGLKNYSRKNYQRFLTWRLTSKHWCFKRTLQRWIKTHVNLVKGHGNSSSSSADQILFNPSSSNRSRICGNYIAIKIVYSPGSCTLKAIFCRVQSCLLNNIHFTE
jgi:hypothetical protein